LAGASLKKGKKRTTTKTELGMKSLGKRPNEGGVPREGKNVKKTKLAKKRGESIPCSLVG